MYTCNNTNISFNNRRISQLFWSHISLADPCDVIIVLTTLLLAYLHNI